jgi:hypothetical protein
MAMQRLSRTNRSDPQKTTATDASSVRLPTANGVAPVAIPVLRVLLGAVTTEDTGQQTRHNHWVSSDVIGVLRQNDPI